DRLVAVAAAAEVAARIGQQLQPLILRLVGVLIFVDQDITEAVAITGEHVRLRAEDAQHMEQEVAEVAGVEGPQPILVLGIEVGAATGGEGLGLAGVDLLWSPAAVLPAIDEAGEL